MTCPCLPARHTIVLRRHRQTLLERCFRPLRLELGKGTHLSPLCARSFPADLSNLHSLWNLPFGADIWLYAEDKVLQVHRSVVAPKSGWIRDKLLPPHPVSMARGRDGPRRASQSDLTQNGAPVGVYFAGAAKIIGHSLKFMYTDRECSTPHV